MRARYSQARPANEGRSNWKEVLAGAGFVCQARAQREEGRAEGTTCSDGLVSYWSARAPEIVIFLVRP